MIEALGPADKHGDTTKIIVQIGNIPSIKNPGYTPILTVPWFGPNQQI